MADVAGDADNRDIELYAVVTGFADEAPDGVLWCPEKTFGKSQVDDCDTRLAFAVPVSELAANQQRLL